MGIKEIIEDAAKRAPQARKDEILDSVIKIQSAMFDKANAYTNIIIAAGYAGTFAIWTQVSSLLSVRQRAWTGCLLLLSITMFVLWEVAKMVLVGIQAHQYNQLAATNPMNIDNVLADWQKDSTRLTHKMGLAWAMFVLPICIGTAVGAAGILVFVFVRKITGL